MPVSRTRVVPVYRRNPLLFFVSLLLGIALIVGCVVWIERRTGWVGIPWLRSTVVPNPPVSGGYVSPGSVPMPGSSGPAC